LLAALHQLVKEAVSVEGTWHGVVRVGADTVAVRKLHRRRVFLHVYHWTATLQQLAGAALRVVWLIALARECPRVLVGIAAPTVQPRLGLELHGRHIAGAQLVASDAVAAPPPAPLAQPRLHRCRLRLGHIAVLIASFV